jgi:hypothetical protein
MLTDLPGHSDYHKFPTQRPTPTDLSIWKTALCKLSSKFYVLTVKLQEYISTPHILPRWLLNSLGTILHCNILRGKKMYHEVYLPSLNPLACRTRSGQCFNSTIFAYGPSNHQQYARVTLSQEGQVLLNFSIPGFVPSWPIYGFEHVIKSFANQTLWISLDYDRDGSWILNGMLAQSIGIIHDGSYMRELFPYISSAVTMIYCTITKA